jgi:hypothetical protein
MWQQHHGEAGGSGKSKETSAALAFINDTCVYVGGVIGVLFLLYQVMQDRRLLLRVRGRGTAVATRHVRALAPDANAGKEEMIPHRPRAQVLESDANAEKRDWISADLFECELPVDNAEMTVVAESTGATWEEEAGVCPGLYFEEKGKQPRDTAAKVALLQLQAGKEPEGTGTSEKGEQPAAQTKSTHTTSQAPTTQPALLAADYFAAALGALPPDDWSRTWAAGRTIMLRRTSKRVREVVDKMRLPAVVRLSRRFWDDARNGTEEAKLQFVLRQLTGMSAGCLITTIELPDCEMKGQDAERLAGVLAQCPALAHLDLSGNSDFGAGGAASLAGVLAQCTALAHLKLSGNVIGDAGAEILAGALGQCSSLSHLNLEDNDVDAAECLAGVLAQCTALAHLDLSCNYVGPAGAASLGGVPAQCSSLTHLDFHGNEIGPDAADSLAGLLAQCTALTHLNLCCNYIGPDGAERLAGVLGQCASLTHPFSGTITSTMTGQRVLQEGWRSAQHWLTSISVAIQSAMRGQRFWQEFWLSAQRWLTSSSATMKSDQAGQSVLQECSRSAHRWFTSISAAITSDQTGQRALQMCLGSAEL